MPSFKSPRDLIGRASGVVLTTSPSAVLNTAPSATRLCPRGGVSQLSGDEMIAADMPLVNVDETVVAGLQLHDES